MASTETETDNSYASAKPINPPEDPNEAWASQKDYGHWISYYFLASLAILTARHLLERVLDAREKQNLLDAIPAYQTSPSYAGRDIWTESTVQPAHTRRLAQRVSHVSMHHQIQAAFRFLAYRRVPFAFTQRLPFSPMPSSGLAIFLLVSTVFQVGLIISKQNFYHESLRFGAPPLSLRCALMATAMVPVQVTLAVKANFITALTGIGHERLNVVHRWAGWAGLVLSLAHAMPYFWATEHEFGSGGYKKVFDSFYQWIGPGVPYSGMPSLVFLGAMCILSLHPLRVRAYEAFYNAHIILGVGYVATLMWHTYDLTDSWLYIYATLVSWLSSWICRLVWYQSATSVRSHPIFTSFQATLELLPGTATRLRVWIGRDEYNKNFMWTPGQHAFVRFTDISPLESHPFTIASACHDLFSTPKDFKPLSTGTDKDSYEITVEDFAAMGKGSGSLDQLPALQPISALSPAIKPWLTLSQSSLINSSRSLESSCSSTSSVSGSLSSNSCFSMCCSKRYQLNHSKQAIFLIRTRNGMTRRLADYTRANADGGLALVNVLLDGPFGGINRPLESLYDTLVLAAGGSGVTVMMPWLAHIAWLWAVRGHKCRTKRIEFIWALRDIACVEWIEETLCAALTDVHKSRRRCTDASGPEINVCFFVTDTEAIETSSSGNSAGSGNGECVKRKESYSTIIEQECPRTLRLNHYGTNPGRGGNFEKRLMALGKVKHGRPDLAVEIKRSFRSGERAFVLGCGPDPLRIDLSNAVAREQVRVMKGECTEIALHLESLGW